MHELAITKEIIRIINKESEKLGVVPGAAMVKVGELTTFVPESIKYYYNMMKKKEMPELVIQESRAEIQCNICNKISRPQDNVFIVCSHCQGTDYNIIKGKEIELVGLDV